MKILVLNSGSSSVKYQLWDTPDKGVLAKGLVSRIGIDDPLHQHKVNDREIEFAPDEPINHEKAIQLLLDALVSPKHGVIARIDEIDAVGHRVVHGGEKFSDSALITPEVIEAIKECIPLAPLHNPPNLMGIIACEKVLDVPQVAIFDTAFHQTMEPYAYIYALPYEFYDEYKIRRYGFHGTSHYYVAHQAAKMLGKRIEELKIITAHLGNGASITAVKNGKCIDTSMGLTPLEGLVMGTRCGDIDPAIVLFIMEQKNIDIKATNNLLNKKSGLLGISGATNDLRDVLKASANGVYRAKLALDVYCYRIRKYIGAYTAAMGGVDVLVFTAGIGENASPIRKKAVEGLEFAGLILDDDKNNRTVGIPGDISAKDASARILVIPTNEELVIATETERIVNENLN